MHFDSPHVAFALRSLSAAQLGAFFSNILIFFSIYMNVAAIKTPPEKKLQDYCIQYLLLFIFFNKHTHTYTYTYRQTAENVEDFQFYGQRS